MNVSKATNKDRGTGTSTNVTGINNTEKETIMSVRATDNRTVMSTSTAAGKGTSLSMNTTGVNNMKRGTMISSSNR